MPGIFSWKNRILGRKTPEPEKAKHLTVVSEPIDGDLHNQAPRRSVRFNDARNKFGQYTVSEWQNEYGEVRVIGSLTPTTVNGVEKCEQPPSNWRYADSSAIRMPMVPLATSEVVDDEPPAQHYNPQRSSRAGAALQLLREQNDYGNSHELQRTSTLPPTGTRPVTPVTILPSDYGMSQSNRWEVGRREQLNGEFVSMGRRLEQMNVVFLQANDEVKRAILPPEVHSLDQVKMAFVRAFPNIPRNYIVQPTVKIYIQEPSKGQLFYELDDPNDIRNKSVLKLRDHSNSGMQSPIRFLDQRDYIPESDSDNGRHRFLSLGRPASAMAHTDYRKLSLKPYDAYDLNGSDTSNHDTRSTTRSGSATPIIDKESRARMESMERQLAGLSSLVHSALVSKGMSESNRREMADLRREILALHTDAERAASEEPPSLPDSLSSHAQHQLDHIRQKLQQASTDMKQLRRTAQVNAQHARNYIREAAEEISRLVYQKINLSMAPTQNLVANNNEFHSSKKENEIKEQRRHEERLLRLLDALTKFENNVENVRSSVLTSNRKLKMSEVESLTEGLTQIGKEAAALKTDFPLIQSALETRIKADMERIVREEKYIREQTTAIDQSLRRCKALANIMVTMKKLAMVQDTTMQRGKKIGSSTPLVIPLPPPIPPAPPTPPALPTPPANPNLQTANLSNSLNHDHLENDSPPPATPQTEDYQNTETAAPFTPTISRNAQDPIPPVPLLTDQSATAELDSVLAEVVPSGAPPPPPSRFSVQDVHQKFKRPPELPEQIKNLVDEVSQKTSPASEANERRLDLERRQERLAEKQRQLRSQFQQLKQMTPLA